MIEQLADIQRMVDSFRSTRVPLADRPILAVTQQQLDRLGLPDGPALEQAIQTEINEGRIVGTWPPPIVRVV